MGKLALFLTMAALLGGGMVFMQSNVQNTEVDNEQSERQETLLAREVARTGYNAMYAKMKQAEDALGDDATLDALFNRVNVDKDNPMTGNWDGGEYVAWVEPGSATSYDVYSVGTFGGAEHQMNGLGFALANTLGTPDCFDAPGNGNGGNNNGHGNNEDGVDSSNPGQGHGGPNGEVDESLEDDDPYNDDDEMRGNGRGNNGRGNGNARRDACTNSEGERVYTNQFELHAGFIESQAGWCSAIYLEQWIPGADQPEIDMVFPPGKYRDGSISQFSTPLESGTQMNFILAVDKNCSDRNNEGLDWDDQTYTHHHWALEIDADDIENMTEGTYAMIEPYADQEGKWRIAFEDQNFYDKDQYLDIKKNGYGNQHWSNDTWGGNGWSVSSSANLRNLRDYGSQPDYSDQVFWIELRPYEPPEEREAD